MHYFRQRLLGHGFYCMTTLLTMTAAFCMYGCDMTPCGLTFLPVRLFSVRHCRATTNCGLSHFFWLESPASLTSARRVCGYSYTSVSLGCACTFRPLPFLPLTPTRSCFTGRRRHVFFSFYNTSFGGRQRARAYAVCMLLLPLRALALLAACSARQRRLACTIATLL